MLKARWVGERCRIPRHPAGFGLTLPEQAHPAQPEGRPDKGVEVCESGNAH